MAGINLSGIFYIYKARLEARTVLVQEGFAIIGIAVGVALLFASQVASTSLSKSTSQLTNEFVGSAQVQLEARGPEGVSEQLLTEVRRVPGVRTALPIFEQQLNLIGRRAERSVDLIGVDPSAVRASGPLLRRFSARQLAAQQAIALPDPIAAEIGTGPLEPVKLQVGSRYIETLVGATLGEADVGALIHSPVAVATLKYAQRLAGAAGRVDRIFVRYLPAQARETRSTLRRLATKWNVNLVPGRFDDRLFAVAAAPETNSETLFSAISALVGFMFALNAMLITVPARRALIEEVRPHGATRWDTVKILLFDAGVIGLLACVLGLLLGELLSIVVFRSTPGYLAVAFPVGNSRIVTWQSVALAIVAGMGAAVLGVFWPLRDVLRQPLQGRSMTHERHSWTIGRVLAGVLCLALSAVTLFDDTQAAVIGNLALVLALIILLPPLFDLLVTGFGRLSNTLNGVASALAVTELQTPQTRVRSLAIAATAAVAVFGVVEFQGAQANLEKGLDAASRGLDATAQLWVMPGGKTGVQPTTPFAGLDTTALRSVPGVSDVGVFRGSFLNWGARRLWLLAPPATTQAPVPSAQITSGRMPVVERRLREGGWAALSTALAAEHHLSVGQSFTLPSPHPLRLRVAALITNLGWPPGALILDSSAYARAWGNPDPTAYTIQTSGNTSLAAVQDRLRAALVANPGLVVETSAERNHRRDAIARQGLSRLTEIRLLVLIAAILAIVGAMGAMIWQRRDLIAFIKCQGYEEVVLWRWLLCEAALLLAAGCAAGAAFGLYGQALLSHALTSVTGFPMVFNIEGVAALTSFAAVLAVALAVVAVPGYLVVRVPPNTAAPAY